jgi:hypothetical protein
MSQDPDHGEHRQRPQLLLVARAGFTRAARPHFKTVTALISAATVVCVISSVFAQSGISQYPYCIQGVDNPGWSGCSFNSLQACQATASGTDSECLTNPWYKADVNGSPSTQQTPFGSNGPLPVGPPPE